MMDNNMIQKRRLGQTGIELTPIGLGVMQFSGGKSVFGAMSPDLSQKQMNAIVKAALDEIAARYNATPAEIALNWLIHYQGEAVVAIPGASRVEHAKQSAGAMRFRLSDEEMNRFDDLARNYR